MKSILTAAIGRATVRWLLAPGVFQSPAHAKVNGSDRLTNPPSGASGCNRSPHPRAHATTPGSKTVATVVVPHSAPRAGVKQDRVVPFLLVSNPSAPESRNCSACPKAPYRLAKEKNASRCFA